MCSAKSTTCVSPFPYTTSAQSACTLPLETSYQSRVPRRPQLSVNSVQSSGFWSIAPSVQASASAVGWLATAMVIVDHTTGRR